MRTAERGRGLIVWGSGWGGRRMAVGDGRRVRRLAKIVDSRIQGRFAELSAAKATEFNTPVGRWAMQFKTPAEARKDLESNGVRLTATFILAVRRHLEGTGTKSAAEAANETVTRYLVELYSELKKSQEPYS